MIQSFVAKINAIRHESLSHREDTSYTLNELLSYVSDGLSYEYNHPSTFENQRFYFTDTVSILNANDDYTINQATNIYESVHTIAKNQALKVNSSEVYLISILPIVIEVNPDSIKIELQGSYVNQYPYNYVQDDTIYMPEDNFFEISGTCVSEYDTVAGAAAYLTKWLEKIFFTYPQNPNSYFGNKIHLVSAFNWNNDEWYYYPGIIYHFSHPFRQALLTLNPNDSIPDDGHYDYVTKAFYYPIDNAVELLSRGCTTPDELSYYAPNARSIMINQLQIHNRFAYTSIFVTAQYQTVQPDDPHYGESKFASWQFNLDMADLYTAEGPLPEKNILQ